MQVLLKIYSSFVVNYAPKDIVNVRVCLNVKLQILCSVIKAFQNDNKELMNPSLTTK